MDIPSAGAPTELNETAQGPQDSAARTLQRFARHCTMRARGPAAVLRAAVRQVAEQMRRFNGLLRSGIELIAFPANGKGKCSTRILWMHTTGALFLTTAKQMGEVRTGYKQHLEHCMPLQNITTITRGADSDVFQRSSQYKKHVRGREDHCMTVRGVAASGGNSTDAGGTVTEFFVALTSARACELIVAKLRQLVSEIATGDGAMRLSAQQRAAAARAYAIEGRLPRLATRDSSSLPAAPPSPSPSPAPAPVPAPAPAPAESPPSAPSKSSAVATEPSVANAAPGDGDGGNGLGDSNGVGIDVSAEAYALRLEKLRKLFAKIDKDGDGQLDRHEVAQACQQDSSLDELLALPRDHGSEGGDDRGDGGERRSNVAALFNWIDADGSGTIGWDEFLAFFTREGVVSPTAASAAYEVLVHDKVMGIVLTEDADEFGLMGRHRVLRVTPDAGAERAGVLPGSELVFVGNTKVRGLSHAAVVQLIMSTPRPTRVVMLRKFQDQGEEKQLRMDLCAAKQQLAETRAALTAAETRAAQIEAAQIEAATPNDPVEIAKAAVAKAARLTMRSAQHDADVQRVRMVERAKRVAEQQAGIMVTDAKQAAEKLVLGDAEGKAKAHAVIQQAEVDADTTARRVVARAEQDADEAARLTIEKAMQSVEEMTKVAVQTAEQRNKERMDALMESLDAAQAEVSAKDVRIAELEAALELESDKSKRFAAALVAANTALLAHSRAERDVPVDVKVEREYNHAGSSPHARWRTLSPKLAQQSHAPKPSSAPPTSSSPGIRTRARTGTGTRAMRVHVRSDRPAKTTRSRQGRYHTPPSFLTRMDKADLKSAPPVQHSSGPAKRVFPTPTTPFARAGHTRTASARLGLSPRYASPQANEKRKSSRTTAAALAGDKEESQGHAEIFV